MRYFKEKYIELQNGESYFDDNIGVVKGTDFEEILDEIENQGYKWGAFDAMDIEKMKNGKEF
jgi:hypothetical protein